MQGRQREGQAAPAACSSYAKEVKMSAINLLQQECVRFLRRTYTPFRCRAPCRGRSVLRTRWGAALPRLCQKTTVWGVPNPRLLCSRKKYPALLAEARQKILCKSRNASVVSRQRIRSKYCLNPSGTEFVLTRLTYLCSGMRDGMRAQRECRLSSRKHYGEAGFRRTGGPGT